MVNATDFVMEHLLLLNSPRFHFISRGATRQPPPYSRMRHAGCLSPERLRSLPDADGLTSVDVPWALSGLSNATIRYCDISARRTAADSHGTIDLTAFNTDGFDVAHGVGSKNTRVFGCGISCVRESDGGGGNRTPFLSLSPGLRA